MTRPRPSSTPQCVALPTFSSNVTKAPSLLTPPLRLHSPAITFLDVDDRPQRVNQYPWTCQYGSYRFGISANGYELGLLKRITYVSNLLQL